MAFPVCLRLGSLCIPPHPLFEVLAYTLAFRLYLALRRRQGDPVVLDQRWWVIAAAAVGALLGAKLLFLLEDPSLLSNRLAHPLFLFDGKTIVGALIGGFFAVEWTKRRLGITARTGDLFALPLCLGIAIGRIGCFLTGLPDLTCGLPTRLAWGVNFGDGVPRHPSQLYEILFLALLFLFILRASRRPHPQGDLYRFFMVGYLVFRFFADFLKPDVRVLLGLSSIQWACVLMLLVFVPDIARWLGPSPQLANPPSAVSV